MRVLCVSPSLSDTALPPLIVTSARFTIFPAQKRRPTMEDSERTAAPPTLFKIGARRPSERDSSLLLWTADAA